MREEMGFISRDARWKTQPPAEQLQKHHVLIVGAGVCAIALGVGSASGIPYTIVEKNAELAHMVHQPVPRLRCRHAKPLLLFSFGARNQWTATSRNARNCWIISERSRSNMTFAAIFALTRIDVIAVGRDQAALDFDAGDRRRRETFESAYSSAPSPAQRPFARPFQGRGRLRRNDIPLSAVVRRR